MRHRPSSFEREDYRRIRRHYLTSKRAHAETMHLLGHMHEHQLQILERINHIMTAFEDLTREVQEMEEKINEALVKIQEFIDQILANPADVAAVTAAAQRLDELQTQITNALAQIPPATLPPV